MVNLDLMVQTVKTVPMVNLDLMVQTVQTVNLDLMVKTVPMVNLDLMVQTVQTVNLDLMVQTVPMVNLDLMVQTVKTVPMVQMALASTRELWVSLAQSKEPDLRPKTEHSSGSRSVLDHPTYSRLFATPTSDNYR
jgi:hypothetical protein